MEIYVVVSYLSTVVFPVMLSASSCIGLIVDDLSKIYYFGAVTKSYDTAVIGLGLLPKFFRIFRCSYA